MNVELRSPRNFNVPPFIVKLFQWRPELSETPVSILFYDSLFRSLNGITGLPSSNKAIISFQTAVYVVFVYSAVKRANALESPLDGVELMYYRLPFLG